ncbi:hypothetical protein IX321_000811 [Bacteroides pyogenes]|nr:hypothetical protein [Bacteroides pyogenes]MBR8706951.1 hypothetical protein [Bacteroides pyogenes]MBR8708024.1 hypothetical protein [Bacteroides pyogenes]MBR8716869.1 hypothetical protein [Bacteroides pyogenes]MBR8746399.1 hypothetical protein [Bacteroides pyogenes]
MIDKLNNNTFRQTFRFLKREITLLQKGAPFSKREIFAFSKEELRFSPKSLHFLKR